MGRALESCSIPGGIPFKESFGTAGRERSSLPVRGGVDRGDGFQPFYGTE